MEANSAPAPPSLALIVDDDEAFRRSTARVLTRAGYQVSEAPSAEAGRAWLRDTSHIAAVLLDIQMPGESGLELLPHVTADYPETVVIVTTGIDDPATAELAYSHGADGYMVKPFTPNELLITLENARRRRQLELARVGELRGLEVQLARYKALTVAVRSIESDPPNSTDDRETIERLSRAISIRDEETGRHLERMSRYSEMLADTIGHHALSTNSVRMATALHDVGKIGVPDTILLKPGPLSPEEFAAVKRHANIGFQLLAGSSSEVLELAATVSLCHHEWWDGSGYPQGLRLEEIPEIARIAAITDVFDALTSHRVYRPALTFDEALLVMVELRGTQFEPRLYDAFTGLVSDFAEIRALFPDEVPEARIRVLIVDDHEIFVQSVARLLSAYPDVLVVGAAGTVVEGQNAAAAYQPDVVLMDFELPDGTGIDATRRIRVLCPTAKVVMLTGRTDRDAYAQAIAAGCAGFVPKTEPSDKLLDAIQTAHRAEAFPPMSNLKDILGRLAPTHRGLGMDLSAREFQVLSLLADGLPNKLIARRLDISINTVGNHVRNVLYKLGAHSRLEAVAVAVREGLIGRDLAANGM